MPARLSPKHDDLTRSKIRTSELVNRLQNHVNGKVDLSTSQVNAAKILLAKVLPDLSATKHSGEIKTPLIQHIPR